MSVTKRKGRNTKRHAKVAKNLAKGMSKEEALLKAGYSKSYAESHGYNLIKRPCIQTIFTESIERILEKRNMKMDEIIEPYVDGLKAKVIVKSQQLGDAQEVDLPDHATRMNAADRIVELYQVKEEKKEEHSGPVTIVVQNYTLQAPKEEPLTLEEKTA